MDTSNKYSKEELLHSLPDYAAGDINDSELLAKIEAEIKLDPGFRNEYEEIKETMHQLSSEDLTGPGDAYFNNLSVRINERIAREQKVTVKEKISSLWKILIPALSIIIIAAVLYTYYTRDEIQPQLTETNANNENRVENKIEEKAADQIQNDQVTGIITEENTSNDRTMVNDRKNYLYTRTTNDNRTEVTGRTINIDQLTALQSIVLNQTKNIERPYNAIAENSDVDNSSQDSDDDLLLLNDDYQDIEDEIMQMTPQQQKEILENLNQKQI